MVEEHTLRELKGRYAAMLAQGRGLIKSGDEKRVDSEGVPKAVDAELIFHLLVQQGEYPRSHNGESCNGSS